VFYYSSAGFLTVLQGQRSPQKRTHQLGAADWNSFRQSIGPPEASLGQKATRVAEIATRVTESFGTANGYLSQARATSPAKSAIFYTPLERAPIRWDEKVDPDHSEQLS
jgi:hypothetical protein